MLASLRSRCLALSVMALAAPAIAQPYDFTIRSTGPNPSSMTATFDGDAAFSGTFIGNYDQTTNPGGTRTLNWNLTGNRPAAPTNLVKTLSGTGEGAGNAVGIPTGAYSITINDATVTITNLNTNLLGAATQTPAPVSATVSYQSFLSATPNYSYPFLIPLTLPLGSAEVSRLDILQTTDAIGPITGLTNGAFTFTANIEADVTATVDFQGAPITQTQTLTLPITGSITPGLTTATATLSIALDLASGTTTPQPQPPNQPFDLPPPTGTGEAAHLLLSLTINNQSTTIDGSASLHANGVLAAPICGSADFNGDGDFGTDGDIEAFFLCLAGSCCPTCWHLGPDFNGDGDTGTDADIEAFFRVLAGNPC